MTQNVSNLLLSIPNKIAGKKVVIVGRSLTVGRPVAQLFLQEKN